MPVMTAVMATISCKIFRNHLNSKKRRCFLALEEAVSQCPKRKNRIIHLGPPQMMKITPVLLRKDIKEQPRKWLLSSVKTMTRKRKSLFPPLSLKHPLNLRLKLRRRRSSLTVKTQKRMLLLLSLQSNLWLRLKRQLPPDPNPRTIYSETMMRNPMMDHLRQSPSHSLSLLRRQLRNQLRAAPKRNSLAMMTMMILMTAAWVKKLLLLRVP